MVEFFYVVFWFGLAIGVGVLAASRGRSGFGFFLLATLLSPALGLIVVMVIRDLRRVEEERGRIEEGRQVPRSRDWGWAEQMAEREKLRPRETNDRSHSSKGPGSELQRSKGAAAPSVVLATTDDVVQVRCPECRELVRADARKCKHCGSALTPQASVSTSTSPDAPVVNLTYRTSTTVPGRATAEDNERQLAAIKAKLG